MPQVKIKTGLTNFAQVEARRPNCIRFGEVNWAEAQPVVNSVTDRETLRRWHDV